MAAFEIAKGTGAVSRPRQVAARLLRFGIAAFLLSGWTAPSARFLIFYLALLPVVAMHRLVARRWRTFERHETVPGSAAGAPRWRPDALLGGAFIALWLLAFIHLALLGDPALLALFP